MTTGMHSASATSEWIHLLPAGKFSGVDGRGPYKLDNASKVIVASMAPGRLPVDENHSIDVAGPKGLPSPAMGWIVEMQSRSDGIWGRIEWTPAGHRLLEDKSYRGVSPVFTFDGETREVIYILRAALTNTPNLAQLATLNSGLAVWHSSLTRGDQQRRQATSDAGVKAAHGLSDIELHTCRMMNIAPSDFAAHKRATAAPAAMMTYGLSEVELNTCRMMNIAPSEFAANKITLMNDVASLEDANRGDPSAARLENGTPEAGREPTYGLTAEEQDACRRMKVSFKDYAVSKRDGTPDPLYMALTQEARNLCDSMKMDPREFALWHVKNMQNARDLGMRTG